MQGTGSESTQPGSVNVDMTAGAGPRPRQRVAVCVATYRRPLGLARLLNSLEGLRFNTSAPPDIRIIIVDNDPEHSAGPVCSEHHSRLQWPLVYEHEPRRGIAQARNRAVHCAGDDVEFLAFIDDDEVPERGWLDELLSAQCLYAADVVSGPVLPVFEVPVPSWMRSFFDRPRYPTGTHMAYARSGNVLIRSSLLRERGLAFDERLALTGGEDTHLFLRIAQLGATLIWADEAVVHEWVPETRISLGWVLRRAYRAGVTWSFCECDLDPSVAVRVRRAAKGLGRITQGLLLLPVAMLRGRQQMGRCLRQVCWGIGTLSGLMGAEHEEYRQVHGG
jgi:succinoglycan biosynthesis protein ExoM